MNQDPKQGQGAGLADVTADLNRNKVLSLIAQSLQSLAAMLPRVTGSFTMDAAASKVILDSAVVAGSVIQLQATNAAAGTLQGSNESLYVSTIVPGVSFTVATAAGTNAAGTETFNYTMINPL